MRGARDGGASRFGFSGMPPLPIASTFHRLFPSIMARLAQALDLVGIPEQHRVTSMRHLVVCHQFRRVCLGAPAHLADEQIAKQDRPAQSLPSCGVIPAPPGRDLSAIAGPACLVLGRGQNRTACGEPWRHARQSCHIKPRPASVPAKVDPPPQPVDEQAHVTLTTGGVAVDERGAVLASP